METSPGYPEERRLGQPNHSVELGSAKSEREGQALDVDRFQLADDDFARKWKQLCVQ